MKIGHSINQKVGYSINGEVRNKIIDFLYNPSKLTLDSSLDVGILANVSIFVRVQVWNSVVNPIWVTIKQ